MKGIVLAAGKGTRMYPMTKPICKPLLPIYDKPMIYYPLAVLLQAGIRDILVIVPPGGDQNGFERLLGDGSQLGVRISYREQPVPRGIADAFIVGEDFIGDDRVCLVLGDNIFFGAGFEIDLRQAKATETGATIFGYYEEDPRPFGVVEIGPDGKAVSLEEKPAHPKSHYIVPGLYFYDNQVVDIAKSIKPSPRGELEITTVNEEYMRRGQLNVIKLGMEFSWYDTGTAESVFKAEAGVRRVLLEKRISVGCLEETAYRQGFITREQLMAIGTELRMTKYGQYLLDLAAK